MITSVAFIGAGNMGARMARRVALGGFEMLICDANPDVRDTFEGEGFRVTDRPADAAAFDVIIVLVASDQQLEDVLFGSDGVVHGVNETHKPTILVMSTTMPELARSIRDRFQPIGVTVIDAPVSGGLVGAEMGTLSIMMAGQDADIDRVLPVVTWMGKNVFRCGDVGAAQIVKLVNNMIAIANIFMVSEAYSLAEKAGVNLTTLGPILEVSTGRTFLSADIEQARRQYASWAQDFHSFTATAHIVRKDMQLVNELASANALELPTLKAVTQVLDDTSRDVFARWQTLGKLV